MWNGNTATSPPTDFWKPKTSRQELFVDDPNITDYDIDFTKLTNGDVIIALVAKGLFLLKQRGN